MNENNKEPNFGQNTHGINIDEAYKGGIPNFLEKSAQRRQEMMINPDCDSEMFTDKYGCTHDGAVGWNPFGHFCGECLNCGNTPCPGRLIGSEDVPIKDIVISATIQLEKMESVNIIICSTCRGVGKVKGDTCDRCGGTGRLVKRTTTTFERMVDNG